MSELASEEEWAAKLLAVNPLTISPEEANQLLIEHYKRPDWLGMGERDLDYTLYQLAARADSVVPEDD